MARIPGVGWLLDRLLPSACLRCGAPGHAVPNLCPGCAEDLPALGAACPLCAEPESDSLCARCRRVRPPVTSTVAALVYAGPVPGLLWRFKYAGDLAAGAALAGVMSRRLRQRAVTRPDALVPMPLHRRRLVERGFNQAMEIARVLAPALEVPVRSGLCRRIRDTAPQAGLEQLPRRRRNVAGAFRVSEQAAGIGHVAIVDDVMTTGASVMELARSLRDTGVRRVDAWFVARA